MSEVTRYITSFGLSKGILLLQGTLENGWFQPNDRMYSPFREWECFADLEAAQQFVQAKAKAQLEKLVARQVKLRDRMRQHLELVELEAADKIEEKMFALAKKQKKLEAIASNTKNIKVKDLTKK